MAEAQPPRRVLESMQSQPWAMLRPDFEAMLAVVQLRANGLRLTKGEKKARIEAARRTPGLAMTPAGPGGVAVLPLMGCLSQRIEMLEEISGGTSLEKWLHEFQEAQADPNVGGIVINACSPGGSVYYVQVVADAIFNARGPKPIIGMVNSRVGSAAYYILSQCDEVVICPGGEAGGIGILCRLEEYSKMNELLGVGVTYVTAPAGGYKAEGNPDEPPSEAFLAYLQGQVDEYYEPFVSTVARGRKTSLSNVRENYGKGRMLTAKSALAVGMVDRIATLDEVIAGMVPKGSKGGGRAESSAGRVLALATEELAADSTVPPLAAEAEPPPPIDLELARARHRLAGARRSA